MRKVNSHGSMIDIMERTGSRSSKNSIVDLVEFYNQEHFKQNTELEKLATKLDHVLYKLENTLEYLNTINDFIRSDKIIKDLRNQNTTIIILLVFMCFIIYIK